MLALLNLIGKAIENLQRSIELFEVSERDAGLDQIASVIQRIDYYLELIDEAPLLKITTIDRAGLGERLFGVKGELALVIESFSPNTI